MTTRVQSLNVTYIHGIPYESIRRYHDFMIREYRECGASESKPAKLSNLEPTFDQPWTIDGSLIIDHSEGPCFENFAAGANSRQTQVHSAPAKTARLHCLMPQPQTRPTNPVYLSSTYQPSSETKFTSTSSQTQHCRSHLPSSRHPRNQDCNCS